MLKQIILFFLSFLLVSLCCEAFIRTAYISTVSPTEFYTDIGRGRRKDLEYVYFNEGFSINKFNEHRYIGEDKSQDKELGIIRIILMGDSFVESFQVFERDYFGNVAENFLAERHPEYRFEILNFGRSGFDLGDIYAYQKTFADNFNADFIVYLISEDDFIPRYSDPLRPKTLMINDSLFIDKAFPKSDMLTFEKTKVFTQNSALINMLNNGRKKISEISVFSILLDKIYFYFIPDANQEVVENSSDIDIEPISKKIIESLDPNKVIIVNKSIKPMPAEFESLLGESDLHFIDLSIKLDSLKLSGTDPYDWIVTNKKGHWNHDSHGVIGIELAKGLSDIIFNKKK